MTLDNKTQWRMCAVVLAATVGCGPVVVGDGKLVTQTKELAVFTRLEVGGAVEATVAVGAPTQLTLTGETNILDQLEVVVREGTLVIAPRPFVVLHPTQPVRVTLSTPTLEAISVVGASQVTTGAWASAHPVELAVGGSSTLVTGEVTAPKVSLSANGASEVTLSGTTGTARFDVGGSSKVLATALASERLEMSVNGSSHLEGRASQEAHGAVNGASQVIIEGNPAVRDLATSGASRVSFP